MWYGLNALLADYAEQIHCIRLRIHEDGKYGIPRLSI